MFPISSFKASQPLRVRGPSLRLGLRSKRLLLVGLLLAVLQGQALAALMLYPTRVVIESNQRAAQVELMNNGTEAETYRISLVNRRMTETGEFVAADEPAAGERFADSMLRYSPRQVTLQPGEGQVVRILVRKPTGLEDGEYRSHLLFERQPDPQGRSSIDSRAAGGDKGVSVKLQALVSASIPVIVRHGRPEANVQLSGLKLVDPTADHPALLAFDLRRSGNRSVYGDLTVTFAPSSGKEQVIGNAGGVAVYTPNPVRHVKLALRPPAGLSLARGALRVTYREPAEEGGKLLAEAVLQLR